MNRRTRVDIRNLCANTLQHRTRLKLTGEPIS